MSVFSDRNIYTDGSSQKSSSFVIRKTGGN